MNWNPILKALTAAAIGGAVPVALQAIASCGADLQTLATQAAAGALVAVAAYLRQSPISPSI